MKGREHEIRTGDERDGDTRQEPAGVLSLRSLFPAQPSLPHPLHTLPLTVSTEGGPKGPGSARLTEGKGRGWGGMETDRSRQTVTVVSRSFVTPSLCLSLISSPSGLVSSAGPFVPHSLHARLVTSSLGAETAPRVMVEGE